MPLGTRFLDLGCRYSLLQILEHSEFGPDGRYADNRAYLCERGPGSQA
jgi:hypothetical protein